jgi:hypothetical protein
MCARAQIAIKATLVSYRLIGAFWRESGAFAPLEKQLSGAGPTPQRVFL